MGGKKKTPKSDDNKTKNEALFVSLSLYIYIYLEEEKGRKKNLAGAERSLMK
jgi:hypothetical protein